MQTDTQQVLSGLATLKNELRDVQQPGVRNSTHLLDLMPEQHRGLRRASESRQHDC